MASELENEGVRAILKRLDALEPLVAKLDEAVRHIGANGGCWSYIMNGQHVEGGHVLAGQDFANTVTAIREDLAELRTQTAKKRFEP